MVSSSETVTGTYPMRTTGVIRTVCLTSNAYAACVIPFAHYWNRFAGSDRNVLVAGYDVFPDHLPSNFEMYSIGSQSQHTWSSGLAHLLHCGRIYDDVILLMLEDYFLTHPLNWSRITALWQLMHDEPVIAKIDLTDDRLKVNHSPEFTWRGVDGLVCSQVGATFQTSLQAALVRQDFLRRFLQSTEGYPESAWQFEKQGTKRVNDAYSDGSFDSVILGTVSPPMFYANAVGGAGSKPGVIEAKHMPDWMWEECLAKGWADG